MVDFELSLQLNRAWLARQPLVDERHTAAFRLYNGFFEGHPKLVIDIYATTAVLFNYADPAETGQPDIDQAVEYLNTNLPWLRSMLLKTRFSPDGEKNRGVLIQGEAPARKMNEYGIWYALDLTMNQDASLYLDTRLLRRWLFENMAGKTVLNTFAYTGSLGVAARAGGASRVVQLDRNWRYLNLAKTSYTLNGFPIARADFITADFWPQAARFRRTGTAFDCVILDPPFFAESNQGLVDLQDHNVRLVNKVRPLVKDGGVLVAINNALFVSGQDYLNSLQNLCQDGYLEIQQLIPVPEDVTGYPETRVRLPVADPAPFNHSTKIAVLGVHKKHPLHPTNSTRKTPTE